MNTDLITQEDIEAVGVTLPEDQLAAFLEHANTTLNERVGAEITDSLTDEEVDEMVTVQEAGDERALQDWLITHVPELAEIVQDEKDIFLGEVAESQGGAAA